MVHIVKAYTNELEQEIENLKKENAKLKQQLEKAKPEKVKTKQDLSIISVHHHLCKYGNHYSTSMYCKFILKGKKHMNLLIYSEYYIVRQVLGIIPAAAAITTKTVAEAAAGGRQLKPTKRNSLYRTSSL